jgi:hypothetical protein
MEVPGIGNTALFLSRKQCILAASIRVLKKYLGEQGTCETGSEARVLQIASAA